MGSGQSARSPSGSGEARNGQLATVAGPAELLGVVIEQSQDLITVTDFEGRIVHCSPAHEAVLGYGPEELVGRRAVDIVHPDDVPLAEAAIGDAVADRESSWVGRMRHKDGRWVALETVASALPGGDARPRMVVSTAREVAERALLAAIVGSSADAIIGVSPDGVITSWNTGAEQIYGFPAQEAIGCSIDIVVPDELQAERALLYERVVHGAAVDRVSTHGRRKDGTPIDVDLTLSLVRDAAGNAIGISAIGRDITGHKSELARAEKQLRRMNTHLAQRVARRTRELEQLNEELRRARTEAEQANQAKSRFLSHVSHELRTPLNAILGFGQLLEMDELGPELREPVDRIMQAGRHLLAVINDMLDIARIESGALELDVEPVELRKVVDETMELAAPLARARDVTLRVSDAPDACVLADRRRLTEVLLNLVDNGISYNRKSGSVELSWAEVGGGRVCLAVRDTGPGIVSSELEKLFSPFQRLGRDRAAESGTGLGLVLSRSLVEAMDGAIGVESELGAGSTFWVELPLAT